MRMQALPADLLNFMAWGIFNRNKGDFNDAWEKLNPGQSDIVDSQGESFSSSNTTSYRKAFDNIEVVNRGVSLIVDCASEVLIDIGDKLDVEVEYKYIRPKKLETILNFKPNPYISSDVFRRNIYIDLIIEGNAFIYFDGSYLYNLPACDVEIHADRKTFIKSYKYLDTEYLPEEIIHIRDNSAKSIYRGESRLSSAKISINTLTQIAEYHRTFFENNAVPGLVITTENVLSEKVKERILAKWMQNYRPRAGGRKPMILDGGFEIKPIIEKQETDFSTTYELHEKKVLKALGVPPILLDSGNNANIAPNLKLFYINTILPLVMKVISSLELFFGYDLKPITQNVLALRPELRDLGAYLTAITNAGIITRNEAREDIRRPPRAEAEADRIIIPANVAGSASNPTTGGKPAQSNQ